LLRFAPTVRLHFEPVSSFSYFDGAADWANDVKKFVFDRTRINEVVGFIADCEGSEPEGERASTIGGAKNGSPQ
jgi:hypothetical protein